MREQKLPKAQYKTSWDKKSAELRKKLKENKKSYEKFFSLTLEERKKAYVMK